MKSSPPLLAPWMTMRSNEFYASIIEAYIRAFGTTPPPPEAIDVITSAWMEYHQCGEYISKEEAISLRTDSFIIMDLLKWYCAGKNCFVFTQELLNEFLSKESKAEDIPIDVLKLPYTHFYIKFGKHSGIQAIAGRDRWVDGCYLEEHPEGVYVTYTQIADDESTGSTGLSFLFRYTGSDTVGDALEAGIKFEEEHSDDEMKIADQVGGDAPRLLRDTEPEREMTRKQRDIVAPQVARLVASCLAYILFVPDDVSDTFLGAPDKMVAKLNRSTTDKERKRNLSKLESSGYSLVRLAGRKVSEQLREVTSSNSSVRPHWRRGHWRLQPVGFKLSQLKLTWVRPTIVRADKGDPEHGHTYKT